MTLEISAYEAKRQERIEANKAMLQKIGIEKMDLTKSVRKQTSSRQKKEIEDALVVLRRSSRLLNKENVQYAEKNTMYADVTSMSRKRISSSQNLRRNFLMENINLPSVYPQDIPEKRTKRSSSELNFDKRAFHEQWLGKQVLPKGKDTVMRGMCPRYIPAFSRMSGIQPWYNGVVLFVNVLEQSMYDNTFTEDVDTFGSPAVYFRWFAQNRHHNESPIVQRLYHAVKGDARLRLNESFNRYCTTHDDCILLFIRQVDGPYVYCGRLGYLGHDESSNPLEFRWQLRDINLLQWKEIKKLIDPTWANTHSSSSS